MIQQIQQLISSGQLEDALKLLAQKTDDALLLLGQYNSGKKNFNLGLIEFADWGRIQSRVSYAALELAKTVYGSSSDPSKAGAGKAKLQIFISYNHNDRDQAFKVKNWLENRGVDVIIDEEDLAAAQFIMEFIQQSIKSADAVISIVSASSLKSGWVGLESVGAMYAVWLADKKFIPLRLDNVAFDIDFQLEAMENIQQKLQDTDAKIERIKALGGSAEAFEDNRKRMFDLKTNLGAILKRFNSVNMLDISDRNFEQSMAKLAQTLQI
ncbi:MAG: TIR domain-containing protein [Bacteroidetes bacterium]|nr:TIR domain-containing protein [Bacteroidota bacterium]